MSNATRRLRILVVENDPDTLKFFTILLEQLGHRVATANCVGGAVEALAAEGCEVLIADIGLLDGTGWDLMDRLRERGRCPPFAIAVSGFGSVRHTQRSAACGFRHHLVKPLNMTLLHAVLAEAAQEIDQAPTPAMAEPHRPRVR